MSRPIAAMLMLAAILPMADIAYGQPQPIELATIDCASSREAVEYKGQKAFVLKKEGAVTLGSIDVRKLEITANSRFTIEIEAAGDDREMFSIRALPLIAKDDKLPAVWAGIVKQRVSPAFRTFKGDFAVANPDGKKTATLLILGLRVAPKGDVWVKSVKVSFKNVEPVKTEAKLAKLKKSLADAGYRLEEKDKSLIATGPDQRRYYTLDLKESYDDQESFLKAAWLGTTWLRAEFKPPIFPMGPYIYGEAKDLTARAQQRKMTLAELFDAHGKDVAAHGGNTIYYANLAGDPETFKMAVAAAQKHGVWVFAQLPGALYLQPAKGKEYFERVTKPAAEKILPQYKGLEGVLGWMGKEEASAAEMPLVIEYRKLCRQLDPSHALFTLHNKVESFRADTEAYAEWYGFDRYRFKVVTPPGVISTPKEAVSLLGREMGDCYSEAARRGRPLICVGQAWAIVTEKTTRMEANSGFREVRPGVWRGWERYLPEHAMHLQAWLAISEGAKGSLWYHYYGASQGRATVVGKLVREDCLVDEIGNESPHWKELGQCFHELKPLTPLFLSLHKEWLKVGSADSPWIKIGSFVRELDRERYFVLLNTRIAEWDKTSPNRPTNQTNLHYEETGLAGLEKVGPLEFKFKPEGSEALWDVLTATRLPRNGDGTYALKLGPGRGVVLMQGNEEAMKATADRLSREKSGTR